MIDRSLYIGMNGAKHAMISLQVIANNMANVNTSGILDSGFWILTSEFLHLKPR